MKNESRVDGPWGDKPIDVPYDGSDLPKLNELYPWQKYIVDTLQTKPDSRSINWVVDYVGNCGKSTLAKYCVFHKHAKFLSFGCASDLLHLVFKSKAARGFLFDLPRTKSKRVSMDEIYSALESIKNGMVLSTKYEGGELLMPSPHVWVFTNYMYTRGKMSNDRFVVWHIDEQRRLVKGEPVKPDESNPSENFVRE